MRTPGNPIKENPNLNKYKRHRIIMPVYIPNEKDYYKEAFQIFELSLHSLIKTVDFNHVNITIINNASIKEVDDLCKKFMDEGYIDQYILNRVNRGKADAIISVAKSSYEQFVTFSDADVLFLPGWIENLETAFKNIKNLGVVCPFPAPQLRFHFTLSTWISNFYRISLDKVVDETDLITFAESIGIPDFFKSFDLKRQYYISSNKNKYCVGAGHFVAMYKAEILKKIKFKPTLMGLKGGLKNIEYQVDKQGYCRVSLVRNYVLHMGNKLESKLEKRFLQILNSDTKPCMNETLETYGQGYMTKYFPVFMYKISSKFVLYTIHLVQRLRQKSQS